VIHVGILGEQLANIQGGGDKRFSLESGLEAAAAVPDAENDDLLRQNFKEKRDRRSKPVIRRPGRTSSRRVPR
jgi:hypothetical protein